MADLSVTKTVSDATPNVGDQITFTVTLSNQGPDDATGVQMTDLLPAGLTFVSATPGQGTYTSATGLWDVGALANGAQTVLTITATVVSPAAQTNTGTISDADQFDPTTANNSASATETPQQADLSVSKTVSDVTPNVGDQITFTVTLSNQGPDDATGVQVTDLLPAGVSFVSANPSQGSYDNASGMWTVGTVGPGIPQTLSITATVVSPAAQTNTGTISDADQFDPTAANNTASANYFVSPPTIDFNVDGRGDILFHHDSGEVYLWEMNGLQTTGEGRVALVTNDWHIQGVGDFNGDFNSDLLWRQDSGQVYFWEMNGRQIEEEGSPPHAPVPNDWHIEGTGDFDGDFKSDIARSLAIGTSRASTISTAT